MAVTNTTEVVPVAVPAGAPPAFQWGPVFLGAFGASAITMVLLAFGSGIGLSATSAYPYAGASAKALAVISGIYLIITAVASFAIGGYVAGRLRVPREDNIDERHFRDGTHGFGVWAVSLVAGGLIAASGIGGTLKTVTEAGTAVAAGGTAGAASNPALANAAASRVSMTPTDYAVDRLLVPGPSASPAAAAPASPPTGTTTAGVPAAGPAPAARVSRGELTAPLTRVFATSLKSGQLDARDRTMLVQIVMQQTGLPQADAEKRVDETYADFKTAEQKARDAAEAARKAALIAAFVVAATLLIACAAACAGAAAGAHHRDQRVVVRAFGTGRFW